MTVSIKETLMQQRFINILAGILLVIVGTGLTACDTDKGSTKAKTTQKKSAQKKSAQKKPEIIHLPALAHYATKEVVGYEDYTNKEQWSEPRIQFIEDYPRKGYDAIWSMKLDGSDIKLAFSMEAVKKAIGKVNTGGVINGRPVRSPDGRYLVLGVLGNTSVLVDLRTQEFEVIDEDTRTSEYLWTADSQNIIFPHYKYMMNYNLKTKKTTQLGAKYRGGDLYLLKNQKALVSITRNKFTSYSISTGKVIKQIELPIDGNSGDGLSPDSRYLYYQNSYEEGVFDINAEKSIFNIDFNLDKTGASLSDGFFMYNNELYIYIYIPIIYI